MNKIAYIASGKIGIHRFTYNELIELKKNNIDFILCLTQLKKGPWMPQKDWKIIVARPFNVLLGLIIILISKKGLGLLIDAYNKKVISYLFIAASFYQELKNRKIRSLHCQMGDKKLFIGYYLKKLLKIPLTVTVHAHELYQPEIYSNSNKIQELYSFCDKIITISQFNAVLCEQNFKVDRSKIEIMHLFPSIDEDLKIKDKIKVLIVANWAEKKGYLTLIEAVKQINRDDFVIWVVGESYYSSNSINLNDLIKEYNLEDKFLLFGRQGGAILEIIFNSCDIFCLPSCTEYFNDGNPREREGIPVALMEAMAWGKPVVTTRHAGIPELAGEILVEERNVEQLRDSLIYLFDNRNKWMEMGMKNREKIINEYSPENVKILVSIFDNLTKN